MNWNLGIQRSQGRAIVAALLILLATAAGTRAELIPIDDFSDGDDVGWTHRNTPANFSVSDGAYRLMGTSPVPTGENGAFGSTWDQSSAPMFQDGYLRARVRANTNSLPWLILRYQGAVASFYLMGIDPSDESSVFFWNRIDNGDVGPGGGFDIPGETVEIGEEFLIEAGAVGNVLSFKVWKPGDPEPTAPQWTRVDATYSTGLFGVGASHYGPQPPAIVDASFDDIVFRTIPEPSTLALACFALGVARRRARQQGRNRVA